MPDGGATVPVPAGGAQACRGWEASAWSETNAPPADAADDAVDAEFEEVEDDDK